PVSGSQDLAEYLEVQTRVGQVVRLGVLRDGRELTLPLELAERPLDSSSEARGMVTRSPRREKDEKLRHDEPRYLISVAAKLVDRHPQTLRSDERLGLVVPSRARGRVRLYSPSDIEQLQRIPRLVEDL